MRITLAAVGRMKAGPLRDLYQDYAGRLGQGPFESLVLREVEERRPLPVPELIRREGRLLLGAVPPKARLIALDQNGPSMTSVDLANLLGSWRDQGNAEVAFVIGGAEGLAEELRAAADRILSLGPMTWPHLLVRALLAEQLYRAQCILTGHPYHRN